MPELPLAAPWASGGSTTHTRAALLEWGLIALATLIDGLRVCARIAADRGPPVIVLVRGVGFASPFFVPVAERLAAHLRVFAVDVPGFGAE